MVFGKRDTKPDALTREDVVGNLYPDTLSSEVDVTPSPTEFRRGDSGNESVIDPHARFNGKYVSDRDLRIEGEAQGEIECQGTLIISPQARVRSAIKAHNVIINGDYEGVTTAAHEWGHTMQTYLSDQAQPYPTHDYATFVAEVASTLNENLLLHHMLGKTQDKATRLFLLGNYLEGLRTTLFRQTLFAEFELKFHQMAEKGEPISGEKMSEMYLGLLRQYYGHSAGVCQVDSLYGVEWAYIQHFYYNFYVYQYATSITASANLAANMRADKTSKYPIDLLKDAGVDMTTSKPFQAAMAEMNSIMNEMEKLLR